MQPSGSWTDAIASAVCRACPAVRTPATSGGTVDHEALADQGVQGALRQADGAGPAGDVPDEEAVVLANGPRLVVVGADGAAQPPVRGVERVHVVRAGHAQAGRAQPGPELVAPI